MVGSVATLLVALVFLAIAAWLFRSARIRSRWPAAGGTVTGGRIRQGATGVGDDESVTYIPVVEYHYKVASTAYTGSRHRISEIGFGSVKMAEKVLARYPVGAAVEVHYNPADPAEAYLECGGAILAWILLAVGAIVLSVAAVLGVNGI